MIRLWTNSTPKRISANSYQDTRIWSWPQFNCFLSSVLACWLLILAIQYGSGYYNYISLTFLSGAVLLSLWLIPLLFLSQTNSTSPTFSTNALLLFTTILLILELYLGSLDVYLHYNQNLLFPRFAKGIAWINLTLVATYFFNSNRLTLNFQRFINYRFGLIILLALILKIVTVFVSPQPTVDVAMMMQESSANLLAGRNPYTSPTVGLGGFVYLPLHLLLPLPFYAILGDTRFGVIVWELVGIILVYRLAWAELHAWPKLLHLAELVILLFVLQPRNLFVIEQAWGEPIIVGLLAATVYFFYYQPSGPLADIFMGALLATKQYLVFMGLPLFFFYSFNRKRFVTIALILIFIILPFFIWNPLEFYDRTIPNFFRLPIQTNSLGVTAYFYTKGVIIPRWISPILASGLALGLGLLLKRFAIVGYLHTMILTFFALFIFGQQAFANYYYLISFMQAMAMIFFIAQQRPVTGNHAQTHLNL